MSELLKINVNDHTERKGQLTYLSWAWAWAEVLKIDPQASWRLMQLGPEQCPAVFFPDNSAMVGVCVTIKGDAKSCVLPVMDNRNKAIKNPDAFAINTAIMRCLAKAIAMHGLGLYIYAGEDLPEGEEPDIKASGPKIAWESLQPEEQDNLRRFAKDMLEAEDARAMLRMIDAAGFDNDQKAGLWYLLDAPTRAAIKKAQQ